MPEGRRSTMTRRGKAADESRGGVQPFLEHRYMPLWPWQVDGGWVLPATSGWGRCGREEGKGEFTTRCRQGRPERASPRPPLALDVELSDGDGERA